MAPQDAAVQAPLAGPHLVRNAKRLEKERKKKNKTKKKKKKKKNKKKTKKQKVDHRSPQRHSLIAAGDAAHASKRSGTKTNRQRQGAAEMSREA